MVEPPLGFSPPIPAPSFGWALLTTACAWASASAVLRLFPDFEERPWAERWRLAAILGPVNITLHAFIFSYMLPASWPAAAAVSLIGAMQGWAFQLGFIGFSLAMVQILKRLIAKAGTPRQVATANGDSSRDQT